MAEITDKCGRVEKTYWNEMRVKRTILNLKSNSYRL